MQKNKETTFPDGLMLMDSYKRKDQEAKLFNLNPKAFAGIFLLVMCFR
jgi:hypothetical protein